MSHLTRFSMISRQVVHSLHHLTWIRDIFAAGGHSQCGQTAHLTQLHSVFAAGGNNMRGRWEQYGTSDVPPDAIFDDFAAGSAFIASPGMDSRHFCGR